MIKDEGLRTLKDLTNFDTLSAIELKKEAIKWIISLEKNYCKITAYCEHCGELEAIINWIKEFFNISDEDLK